MSLLNTVIEIVYCFEEFKRRTDILYEFLAKQEDRGHPQAVKLRRRLIVQRRRLYEWRSLADADKIVEKAPLFFLRFKPAERNQVLDYLGKITDSFGEIGNLILPPLEGQLDNIHSGIGDPSQGNIESTATYWEELRKRLNANDIAINCLFELVPPRRRDAWTSSPLHFLKGVKKSLQKRI
ncbi:hypothetical protein FQN50_002756 [Emmonsiellopsis sp. PD_5]|nr:hypothetical protein FQN50_002756 [Emmonsiellopsis sp. PD_5]